MARNEFYCQCTLRRPAPEKPSRGAMIVRPLDGSSTYEEMVSYIPSDKAKVGNIVMLKVWPGDKEWSEGWEVIYAGLRRSGKYVEENAENYRHQREESDARRDTDGSWDTPNRRGKKRSA